jgi:hypothetical protein
VVLALAVPAFVEWSRRPSLRIEKADDANSPDPYWRIVHIRVVNEPLAGRLSRVLLRNSATGCRVSMKFTSKSDGKTIDARGKWSAQPEPLAIIGYGEQVGRVYDPEKIPVCLIHITQSACVNRRRAQRDAEAGENCGCSGSAQAPWVSAVSIAAARRSRLASSSASSTSGKSWRSSKRTWS